MTLADVGAAQFRPSAYRQRCAFTSAAMWKWVVVSGAGQFIDCLPDEQLLHAEGKQDIQHTFSSHFEEAEANELDYMQTVIQATGVQGHFTYLMLDDFSGI